MYVGYVKCLKCEVTRKSYEFYKTKAYTEKVCIYCRVEPRKLTATSYEGMKNRQLKTLYGITLADFEQMLAEQNGLCKICNQPEEGKSLCVDHCHTTGVVRGLLCGHCNRGLGYFRDDIGRLEKAIEYLKETK